MTVRDDRLDVEKPDATVRLWINDTQDTSSTADDTEMWNATAALSSLDLLDDPRVVHDGIARGENLTIQEGVGSTSYWGCRRSAVEITRPFSWSWSGEAGTRYYILTLEDNTSVTWRNVRVFIPFLSGTAADPTAVSVFDMANDVDLTAGLHFRPSSSGVEFEVPEIGVGISRSWKVSYKAAVKAEFSVITLIASTATPDSTFAGAAFKTTVLHQQPASETFSGDVLILFQITDPQFSGRPVSMMNLVVVDARTTQRVVNWWPHLSRPNALVIPDVSIPAGAVASWDLFFSYQEPGPGGIYSFLGSELGAVILVLAVIIAVVMSLLASEKYEKRRRRREG